MMQRPSPCRAVVFVAVLGASGAAAVRAEVPAAAARPAFVRAFSPAERPAPADTHFQRWLVSAPSSFASDPEAAEPAAPVRMAVLASAADHFRVTPRAPAPEAEPVVVGGPMVAQWHAGPVGGYMAYVPRSQAFDWGSVPRRRGWWGGPFTGFGSLVLAPGLTGGGVRHISVAYSALQFVESAMQREQWIVRGGWWW